MSDFSIVEYFAEHEGYHCGYCKSPDTNYSHGMWAHTLMVQDYQDLIDRGWRRSGKYCYKPTMEQTCCPMYTIKCSVQNLKLSKSQKKVLKRMNRFLAYGKNSDKEMMDEDSLQGKAQSQIEYEGVSDTVDATFIQNISKKLKAPEESRKYSSAQSKNSRPSTVMENKSPKMTKSDIKTESAHKDLISEKQTPATNKAPRKGAGPEPDKPLCRKAKDIRRERRIQKLKNQGLQDDFKTNVKNLQKQKNKGQEKTLEDYINQKLVSNPVHRLEVQLVQCEPRSHLFDKTLKESYQIYKKYQMFIHKEPPEKCSENQFLRFLASGPLQSETLQAVACGSFHQQYLLDGKIIAVGVIDILPSCVSSVYLFYDPQYSYLSLGTYAALREIYFTRELNRQSRDLDSYYMGFYIHSCPKMRYKAQFNPSYLVCPETFTWQSYEKCKTKLDQSKYSRLEDNREIADENGGEIEFDSLLVLSGRRVQPYSIYQQSSRKNDLEEVKQYATLVGRKSYSRMLLYRSSS